jgi:hypothetical protein
VKAGLKWPESAVDALAAVMGKRTGFAPDAGGHGGGSAIFPQGTTDSCACC